VCIIIIIIMPVVGLLYAVIDTSHSAASLLTVV